MNGHGCLLKVERACVPKRTYTKVEQENFELRATGTPPSEEKMRFCALGSAIVRAQLSKPSYCQNTHPTTQNRQYASTRFLPLASA